MEPILSECEVIKFLSKKGGKSTNHELVSNFKGILNDPVFKVEARLKFKDVINTVAKVEDVQGVKYIKLKNEYYNPLLAEEIQPDNYDSQTEQTSSGYTSPYSQGYQPYWRYRLSSNARQLSIPAFENALLNDSSRSRSSSSGSSADLKNTSEGRLEGLTDRTRLVSRNNSVTEYGLPRSESNSPQRTRASSNASPPRRSSCSVYPSISSRERTSSYNELPSQQELYHQSLYLQQEPLRQNFCPSNRQNFSPAHIVGQNYSTTHEPRRHSFNAPQEKQSRQKYYSPQTEAHCQNSYYQDEPLYENLDISNVDRISPPREATRDYHIPSQDFPQQRHHSPQIPVRPSYNVSQEFYGPDYLGSHESLNQSNLERPVLNYKASQDDVSQSNNSNVTRHSSSEQNYCSPDRESVRQSTYPLEAESARSNVSLAPHHLTIGLPLVTESISFREPHEAIPRPRKVHSNSTSKTSLSTRHCDKVKPENVKQNYSNFPVTEVSRDLGLNEKSSYHNKVQEPEKTKANPLVADDKVDVNFKLVQDSCDKNPAVSDSQNKVEDSNEKGNDLHNNSNNESPQSVNGLVKQRVRHIDDIEKHKSTKKSFLNVSAGKENTIVKTHGIDDEASVTMVDPKLKRLWFVTAAQSDYHGLVSLLKKEPKLAGIKDIASGYTALHWAAKHGDANVVKLIAGAYRVNPNIRSNGGYTSIHLAALHKHEPIVHLLVHTYGANPAIRDYSGKKANQYPNNYLDVVAGIKKMERKPLKPRPVVKEPSGVFIRIGSLNLRKSRRSAVFASVRSTGRLKNWNSSDNVSEMWNKSSGRSSARTKKSTKNHLIDKKSDTDSKNGSDSDSAYGFHPK